MTAKPDVKGFFDQRTYSIQYVVSDPATGKCAIIDPVLDYDEKSGATATRNADAILDYIKEKGLSVEWILDTHPHADHFSAARYLKDKTGAAIGIGSSKPCLIAGLSRASISSTCGNRRKANSP